MEIITDIAALRTILKNKVSTSFVPTMGNLHEGHLSLVQKAKQQHTDCTVVSIFVNPLQFSPNEDFDEYPRTLDNDCQLLKDCGVDIVFAPNQKTLYPKQEGTLLTLPPIANMLEGQFRPGFFHGVATVVLKLFNIVQPSVVIFGKKDYQQLHIIKKLIQQLNLPIEILAGETIRTSEGLALSSRNNNLSKAQQIEAAHLYQVLLAIKQAVEKGNKDFNCLQREAIQTLAQSGWKVDYITIRKQSSLKEAALSDKELVVLGAAWLNKTRLIDNLEILKGISKNSNF